MGMEYRIPGASLSFQIILFVFAIRSNYCTATEILSQSQQISVGQTLSSRFFRSGNSSKQYVGIWYKNISVQKVTWVVNRENHLAATDTASSLTISKDGNLRLLDGMKNAVWWTNVAVQSNSSLVVLLDQGDLALKDNVSGLTLWESFNHPRGTFAPGMKLGLNTRTGEKQVSSLNIKK